MGIPAVKDLVGALYFCLRCLLRLHIAHPLSSTWLSTSTAVVGQWKCLLTLSLVFAIPQMSRHDVIMGKFQQWLFFVCSGTTNSFLSSLSFHKYHRISSDNLSKKRLVYNAFTIGDKHANFSVVVAFVSSNQSCMTFKSGSLFLFFSFVCCCNWTQLLSWSSLHLPTLGTLSDSDFGSTAASGATSSASSSNHTHRWCATYSVCTLHKGVISLPYVPVAITMSHRIWKTRKGICIWVLLTISVHNFRVKLCKLFQPFC